MSIENLVSGVSVEVFNEGLDNTKNPARVVIRRKDGKTAAIVYAVVDNIKGADGGFYPAVKFEMRGVDPVSEPIPLESIVFCPVCARQHIDEPDLEIAELAQLRKEHELSSLGDKPYSIAAEKLGRLLELEAKEKELWSNPPHKSHLCQFCGTTFRLVDGYTVGVESITPGERDTWHA